ncbi:hypothetical protein CRUP_037532 [Coryphaenoides rupestris]|nr:hypothetical protein CRUP_037532 [Coryphaenoides rupestris]
MYGADDFLPMLTYVLAQCDLPQLDAEVQYMMELLDPSLLHGEGSSLEKRRTRNTLHQWHRRRTAPRAAPSVDDFQNYLRIALQEADSGGCTAKTLLVRPYSTTEEVCSLCAYKFKVADPENYALFLLSGDTSQQLAPDTHPQLIKSEMHSRPCAQAFHFTYRRVVVGAGLSHRGPAHLRKQIAATPLGPAGRKSGGDNKCLIVYFADF